VVARWQAARTYLFISAAFSFFGTTLWVVGAVYYILSVHMNPFQLVLVGTILEVSYLLCQVPTGLFADTYSRRLSFIMGGLVAAACWVVEGSIALFIAIALAEAVRGAGEAFVDGALPAWLADEVGEEQFGRVMLRGSQIDQVAGILGMPAGVALASFHLYLPMRVGGIMLILVNLLLILVTPEIHFRPARHEHVSRRAAMRATLGGGVRTVRAAPVLLAILGIGLCFGAFSEGFDRLWEAHFLHDISFPSLAGLHPVVWFGIINVVTALVGIAALQGVHRWVDMADHRAVGRTLFGLSVLLIAGVLAFGLAPGFAIAFAAFALARTLRKIHSPVYATWLNGQIDDSRVRATVLSMQGGLDAFGQSAVGPVIGAIGTVFSLRAAITTAGAILLPALPLYAWVLGRGASQGSMSGSPQPSQTEVV
jgi:DHA3 family tetracycline resistance protein-like MFS transporter